MIWKPWTLFTVAVAGWMSQQQQEVTAYLREENKILGVQWHCDGPTLPPVNGQKPLEVKSWQSIRDKCIQVSKTSLYGKVIFASVLSMHGNFPASCASTPTRGSWAISGLPS